MALKSPKLNPLKLNPWLIDELAKSVKSQDDLFGKDGVMKQLVKAIAERSLGAELGLHLGYEKHDSKGRNSGNSRNGTYPKTVSGEYGDVEIDVPRDREGSFEPLLIPKGERRFEGIEEKIVALYARGNSTRDIQEFLKELYGIEVSPTFISNVTDAVKESVDEWQSRALEQFYLVVYFDAVVVKIRDDNGQVVNKSIYLALGVNKDGKKELLGIWINQTEGAKFWLSVMTELKNRGVLDIGIACVDGLKGFPAAINAVFPQAEVQLCIVHMIRNSLRYVSWKDRKEVATDLRAIYTAATIDEARRALDAVKSKWGKKYAMIGKSWEENWDQLIPFFGYPREIRTIIYTTNAIESANMCIRKVIKNKRSFPSDGAALKMIYLAMQNMSKKWKYALRDWSAAVSFFVIKFEGRFAF